MSSILVARDGFGDMAVSNAIGSNVFDINLGLGLPFLIRILIDKGKAFSLLSSTQQVRGYLVWVCGVVCGVGGVVWGVVRGMW